MVRLVAVGMVVIAAGILLVLVGSLGSENVSTGGFILVGPFPIVFGSGGNGTQLAFLSLVTGILIVAILYILSSRSRSRS